MKKMDWAKRVEIASEELLKPLEIKKGWCKGKFDYKPIKGLAPVGTPYARSGIFDHIICDDVETSGTMSEDEFHYLCKDFGKQHLTNREAVDNALKLHQEWTDYYNGGPVPSNVWEIPGNLFQRIKRRLRRPRMFSKRKEIEIKNLVCEKFDRMMARHNEEMHKEPTYDQGFGTVAISHNDLFRRILLHLRISLKTTCEKTELVSFVEKKRRVRKPVSKSKKGS